MRAYVIFIWQLFAVFDFAIRRTQDFLSTAIRRTPMKPVFRLLHNQNHIVLTSL